MLKQERFQVILDQLGQNNRVLLTELSALLGVSEDTVRRDIKALSDQGLLQAVRGGAVPPSPVPHQFKDRMTYGNEQKKLIAQKAVGLLKDGQVIILDGGTSTLLLATLLPADISLTVITNSFPIASVLEEHQGVEVLFAGGQLMKSSFVTVGADTIDFFRKFRPDICFLGICSIHRDYGVTGPDFEESQVKAAMVQVSKKVVALSSTEKMDTAESYYICPADELHSIVTDQIGDMVLFEKYKNLGIKLL
ncbi:DeoR/GlpR family DNA-binding transcription regulator [Dyadobacter tibetensis]|uniref:DeoR/GlpR family DNA-binding transcription regulator n=1 Tax=Dyadobacter tibetensis TaxID=1211851 RepID=UPI00046EE8FF|nr:DeoR/GlpR family DNA-binding transcription regulator [Dyadobacter tibetensis]